jgi:nicotinamide-nucleotide amidase
LKPHAAWVLTVGDELLRGEIVDSNKSFLSQQLLELELHTGRHVTVADDRNEISEQLQAAAKHARVLLISGGLGPTRDDITTEVVAQTFGRKLVRDAESVETIRAYFNRLGREMSDNNAKQADFPEGAEVLPNPNGTAPGFMLGVEDTLIFCMPGVPSELYAMMQEQVMPRISQKLGIQKNGIVRAQLLRTFGFGESVLDRDLADLSLADGSVELGFRVQFPDNLIRVVAHGRDEAQAEQRLQATLGEVRSRLGPAIVAESEERLETVVGRLLLEQKRTVAVAESCTGGLIGHLLTEVPGSSGYFLEGMAVYSNAAKMRDVAVPAEMLEEFGAVSEPVAQQMAIGVRERAGADIGVSTTGIAGPGGGTDEKPVGTLCLGFATAERTLARTYRMLRDRPRNKLLAAHIALDCIRRELSGLEIPDETFPRIAKLSEAR